MLISQLSHTLQRLNLPLRRVVAGVRRAAAALALAHQGVAHFAITTLVAAPLAVAQVVPASPITARGAAVSPRQIAEQALQAASAGTLAEFRRGWQQQSPTANSRLSSFALGTAARLEYRFADAATLLAAAEGDTTAADLLSARAALGRAAIESQQFNLRGADTLLRRAVRVARSVRAQDVEAEAMVMLVLVRQRLQGVPAALATADTAATRLSATDAVLQTELLCRRAQVRVRAGDTTAIRDAVAGVAKAAQLRAPRTEGLCWQAVGQSHQMRDELRDAARAFGRAAERHAAANDLAGVAASLQWRGFFNRVFAEFDSAQSDYQRAIAAGTTSGNRAPVAWSWLGLSGLSLAAGEPVRAADEAQRAGVLLAAIGDRWGLAAWSTLAGRAAVQLGDFPRARLRLREAIARSDSLGAISDEMIPSVGLIDVERELDGEVVALRRIAAIDTLAARTGIPGWAGQRWYHMAQLALRRSDGTAALQYLTRFERTFSRVYSSATSGFDFAVRRAEAMSLAGDPLGGARALDVAIEAFASWRNTLGDRAMRMAVWEQRGLDGDPDLSIATIIARAAMAGHDTLAFRLAGARRARDLRTVIRTPAAASPVDATVLALHFVTGSRGEPTTLFVRHGNGLRSVQLPPVDSLARRIGAFRSLLSGDAFPRTLARDLGSVLLDSALTGLDTSVHTLIVVPDGALNAIPWSALTLASGEMVLDRFTVVILPSGSIPARAAATTTRRTAVAVAADAGVAAWEGERLPPLPRAMREAERVAESVADGRVLHGNAATEFAVKALTSQPPALLHLAAHAIVDERSASRAAVMLRGGNGEDGVLEATEIASLRLPIELVVLAGCRTASGLVFATEGMQGLVRPLLDAGVRGVVASQWEVRDESAAQIMQWFYAALSTGASTADALRAAQLRGRDAGLPAGDWASWNYIGDPAGRPDVAFANTLASRGWTGATSAVAVLAFLLLSGAAYFISKRRVALRT